MRRYVRWLAIALAALCWPLSEALAERKNGFDLTGSLIPAADILHGGPPRDGIPAIDQPVFIDARQADFLQEEERVLGLHFNQEARAYPIRILNWHEIVNDRIQGEPVVISYCPLCGTGVGFRASIDGLDGRATTFGVSGLLYNSDVLLYDRETESLWSQILGQAISGPLRGTRLQLISLQLTSWRDWRTRYPDTQVLSTKTGFRRDYQRNPYAGYERSRQIYFKVSNRPPPTYHPKEPVLGLDADGVYKAYPFAELSKLGQARFSDTVNGRRYTIVWDAANRSARILDPQGQLVPAMTAFWFAWFTFHPDTLVFTAPE